MFNSEETGEDTSNVTPVAEETVSLSKSHRDLGSADTLEVSPATEEDETTQDELATSQDPPEDAKEDPAPLGVSQEVFEVHSVKPADQGRMLRTTTIVSTTAERSYTQERADEETEEEDPFAICDAAELGGDVVEEMGKRREDEELANEEQAEKKGAAPQEISAEHADPAELEEGHASDHLSEETEEPPVVQMRGHRGRRKVHPKPKEVEREAAPEVVSEKDDVDQPTVSAPDGLELTNDCELPSLQHVSVILVDPKTNSNSLSVVVPGGTSEAPCCASETGEVELIAPETMDQEPEPASTEELGELEEATGIGNHQGQEHEDIAAGRTCEEDHEEEMVPDEAGEEKEPVKDDGATAEEEATEEASTQPDVNEEMRLEGEAPTNLHPSTEATEEADVSPEGDGGPLSSPEHQENAGDSTHPDTVMASNPKEASGASEEKQRSEDVALQESDLQRVTVVLMDLRSSSQSQVAEEQPPAGMEEDEQPEAAPDAFGDASDVSEEAVAPTPLSGDDGEAEGGSGVEEVPVVESRVLRSGRKMGYTRTLRKGRRSAAATPLGKPRAHANGESDETIPTLEEQREEPKPDLEDITQKDPRNEGENKEEVGVAQEEETLQPQTEEPRQDEPTVIGRVLRKAKRSAPATPIRRSKRSRLQPKSEEGSSAEDRDTGGTTTDDGEIPEIKNGDQSVDPREEKSEDMDVVSAEATREVDPEPRPNGAGETSPRESASVLQTMVVADDEEEEAPAPGTKSPPLEEDEEQAVVETSSGPDKPGTTEGEVEELAEEGTEKVVDGESAEPEDVHEEPPAEAPEAGAQVDGTEEQSTESPTAAPEEEAPDVTSRSRRSKTRTSQTTPAPTSSLEKLEEETQQHVEDGGDEETQKEPEGSGDAVQPSSTEEDTDEDLPHRKDEGPDVEGEEQAEDHADFVGGPSGFTVELESDDEDEKESDSEEEEDVSGDEPIVMGKKVLRGRTVPALIISPKTRRSKGLLSDDDKSPGSARKDKLKRKRSEVTPARKFKRRSRVQL